MSSTPFHTSAYDAVYAAVVARLTREGVTVGKTAFLPRIEVHTVTEGQRQEKGGDVRTVDLTVESVSNRFLGEASQMNTENLRLLTETPLALEDPPPPARDPERRRRPPRRTITKRRTAPHVRLLQE